MRLGITAVKLALTGLEQTRIAIPVLCDSNHVQILVPVHIEDGVVALEGVVRVLADAGDDVPHDHAAILAAGDDVLGVRGDAVAHVVLLRADADLLVHDVALVDFDQTEGVVAGLDY